MIKMTLNGSQRSKCCGMSLQMELDRWARKAQLSNVVVGSSNWAQSTLVHNNGYHWVLWQIDIMSSSHQHWERNLECSSDAIKVINMPQMYSKNSLINVICRIKAFNAIKTWMFLNWCKSSMEQPWPSSGYSSSTSIIFHSSTSRFSLRKFKWYSSNTSLLNWVIMIWWPMETLLAKEFISMRTSQKQRMI